MDETKERMMLAGILDRFGSAAIIKGNKLRGLPAQTQKEQASLQIVADLCRQENNLAIITQLSVPAHVLLRYIAQGPTEWSYRELEMQMVLQYGIVFLEEPLRELSHRFLILPAYADISDPRPMYRQHAFESGHPELYPHIWCPSAVKAAAGQLGTLDISQAASELKSRYRLTIESPPPMPSSHQASFQPANALHLVQDIFSLLAHLQRKPVNLTAKGRFPINDSKRICKNLNFQDVTYAKLSPTRYREDPLAYSYFSFLYWLCEAQGLIRRQGLRLQVEHTAIPTQKSIPEKINEWFRLWLTADFWDEMQRIPELSISNYDLYSWGKHNFYLHYLPRARALIVHLCTQLKAQQWIALDTVRDEIYRQAPQFIFSSQVNKYSERFYGYMGDEKIYRNIHERKPGGYGFDNLTIGKDWDRVEGRFIRNVISEPLHWLGLVDLALGKDGTVVGFRITELGATILGMKVEKEEHQEQAPCFIVQPNFDIIAYQQESLPDTLWFLSEIAEMVSSQQTILYRLTRNSFYKAIEKGYTAEKIRDFLGKGGKTPLPQNVAYTLTQWETQCERIQFYYGPVVLELESAELAQELVQSELRDKITASLSPTCLHIKPEAINTITEWLKNRKQTVATCLYGQRQPRTIVVGKDMKILLPDPQDKPYQQYKLRQFAGLAQATPDYHLYQLTLQSVKEARKAGMTVNKIMKWLQEHNIERLPIDFAVTMTTWNWEKDQCVLGLQKAYIISDSSDSYTMILESLAGTEDLGKLIFLLRGHHMALVAEANLELLRRELAQRNIRLDPAQFPDLFPLTATEITQETVEDLLQKYRKRDKAGAKQKRVSNFDGFGKDIIWQDALEEILQKYGIRFSPGPKQKRFADFDEFEEDEDMDD